MGLPPRHAGRARGGCVRRLRGARAGTSCRRRSSATDRTARAWCSCGATRSRTQAPVDIVGEGEVPAGFRHVFDGLDAHDQAVSLVHEDSAPLRRMALFDVVVNNADRKGGHVLPMPDGHRHGVDHGLTFHVEHKLRTVLWGFVGDAISAEEADGPARARGGARRRAGRDALRDAHRRRGRDHDGGGSPGCWRGGRSPARARRRTPSSPGRPSETAQRRPRNEVGAWARPDRVAPRLRNEGATQGVSRSRLPGGRTGRRIGCASCVPGRRPTFPHCP